MDSEICETLDQQIAITFNQTVKVEIKPKPLLEIALRSFRNLQIEDLKHGFVV